MAGVGGVGRIGRIGKIGSPGTGGGAVPAGYLLFRVKQADLSYSRQFMVKQADGSYRRLVSKGA